MWLAGRAKRVLYYFGNRERNTIPLREELQELEDWRDGAGDWLSGYLRTRAGDLQIRRVQYERPVS